MKSKYVVSLAALLAAVGGCLRMGAHQERARTQLEVGATHVSVLSIADWYSVRDNLKPNFTSLTGDAAIRQAVASTAAVEERLFDSFAGSLRAGLPTNSVTSVRKEVTDGEGKTTTTSERTQERNDGELPEGGAEADKATTIKNVLNERSNLVIDPMMKYLAATALKQEVELLNLYVQNAPVKDGYRAFVVRMQVSLLPRARNQPYDAYTTLSFLPTGLIEVNNDDTGSSTENGNNPQQMKLLTHVSNVTSPEKTNDTSSTKALAGTKNYNAKDSIRIVPLLVTDNLEAVLRSGSYERIRQISASLTAVASGASIGADLDHRLAQVQQVLSTDLNSLMTVGRVADNAVCVRFGAQQIGHDAYSMVARTHNVTVLVVVKDEVFEKIKNNAAALQVVSRTEYVDASSGRSLKVDGIDETIERAHGMIKKYGTSTDNLLQQPEAIRQMLQLAAASDFDGFAQTVDSFKDKELQKVGMYLWADFASLASERQYAMTSLDLAAASPVIVFPQRPKPVFVYDNGADISIDLFEGSGLTTSMIDARLVRTLVSETPTTPAATKDFPLRATALADGSSIKLNGREFRKFMGIERPDEKVNIELKLRLVLPAGRTAKESTISSGTTDVVVYKCEYSYSPPAQVTLNKVQDEYIPQRSGSINVEFDVDIPSTQSKQWYVRVNNPEVLNSVKIGNDKVLASENNNYVVLGSGRASLTMKVDRKTDLNLELARLDGTRSPVQLAIKIAEPAKCDVTIRDKQIVMAEGKGQLSIEVSGDPGAAGDYIVDADCGYSVDQSDITTPNTVGGVTLRKPGQFILSCQNLIKGQRILVTFKHKVLGTIRVMEVTVADNTADLPAGSGTPKPPK